MSELAHCPGCGEPFYRDHPWKRLCLTCWKKEKGLEGQPPGGHLARLQDLERRLRGREMLLDIPTKALIRLCHPDRHGGDGLATEVTQILLSVLAEERRAQMEIDQ